MFGEIRSFETIPSRNRDVPRDSTIFVIFNVDGREPETTNAVRGNRVNHGFFKSQDVFLFNRPITHNHGDRMFFQVVQVTGSKQKLIGYGYTDLVIEPGQTSRMIDVFLWRPKSRSTWSEYFGFINPLVEPGIVEFPPSIDRSEIDTVTVNGTLKVYIQICGYN